MNNMKETRSLVAEAEHKIYKILMELEIETRRNIKGIELEESDVTRMGSSMKQCVRVINIHLSPSLGDRG